MWKLVAGFVVFAALTVWLLSKGGDVDMSGEKHGIDTGHDAASAPAMAASPVVPAASVPTGAAGASAPASAASM